MVPLKMTEELCVLYNINRYALFVLRRSLRRSINETRFEDRISLRTSNNTQRISILPGRELKTPVLFILWKGVITFDH